MLARPVVHLGREDRGIGALPNTQAHVRDHQAGAHLDVSRARLEGLPLELDGPLQAGGHVRRAVILKVVEQLTERSSRRLHQPAAACGAEALPWARVPAAVQSAAGPGCPKW